MTTHSTPKIYFPLCQFAILGISFLFVLKFFAIFDHVIFFLTIGAVDISQSTIGEGFLIWLSKWSSLQLAYHMILQGH